MRIHEVPRRHPVWPLLIVGLGTLVVPLDSAVNIGFPAIVSHFDLPLPRIQWVVISYVLTQTSLMLTFGRLGDLLGYRRVFLFGTGFSAFAFLGCALAPNYAALVAARVAQGIGAGLILSCGPALATSLFPEAMRTQVLARYMVMFGIGSALGPSVFGLLVERYGWSAVFSFRAPIALAAFLLAWTLPRPPRPDMREAFDALGGALLAVALGFLLLALNQLRHPSPELGVYLLFATVSFGLFYRQEVRCARPIIDFAYFRDRDFTVINASNALVNMATFSIMLLAPFYLSRVPGLSLPQAGLLLAASPFGGIFAAPLAARLAQGRKPREIALMGMALSALGLYVISFSGSQPNLPVLALAMGIQGFGMGLFQVAYLDTVTTLIPIRNRGVAGALGMATRSIGIVSGATILMLVFQTLQETATLPVHDGFIPAFQWTFRLAATIPAMLVLLDLLRGRPRLSPR